MLRTFDEWYEFAFERGTDGSMVFDILKDWKEREQETADLLTACAAVMREDGHYDQCPCPGDYSHDHMPRNATVAFCQRLQDIIAKTSMSTDATEPRR